MKKYELLKWLQDQYYQWQDLLDQIGPARMEQPGVNGDWSMKDMVAHLTGWNRWLVVRLESAQHGEPEPPPPWPKILRTEDEINTWLYETSRQRNLTDIMDEMHQVFQQFFTLIESLPNNVRVERIEPAFYLIWVNHQRFLAGEFFDHFRDDHEPDVRRWLAREEKH